MNSGKAVARLGKFGREGRLLAGPSCPDYGPYGLQGRLADALLDRLGAEIAGLALDPEGPRSLFGDAGLGTRLRLDRRHDIADAAAVRQTVEAATPELVIHLAAQSLVRRSYAEPLATTLSANALGTAHVLEARRHVDTVRAIVIVTTDKVYENREWPRGYREIDALGGADPYSASKACAELVAAAWTRSFLAERGVAVATARAGNVIGGGDWCANRLLSDLFRAIISGTDLQIRRPEAVRPWQHVLDALNGYLTLAERLLTEPATAGGAWNFGPGDDDVRTVRSILERWSATWEGRTAWSFDPQPGPHETTLLRLDSSKARQRLGWRPRLDLDTAIDWTQDWLRVVVAGNPQAGELDRQIDAYLQREPLS